jgi:ferrous iron transport protein B
LTGLNQQVGNYPGITVEKRLILQITHNAKANILDLPGTYSLNASSIDENVVIELLNKMISYIQTLHLLLQMKT